MNESSQFPASPSAFSTLLRARRLALRNRIAQLSGQRRALWLLCALLVLGVMVGFGHNSAASLMIPPIETTAPTGFEARSSEVAGARALDMAFWLAMLIGAIFSFRVMELLFRREDIRRLSLFPLSMGALFLDRVLAGVLEALVWGGVCGVFFLPLVWHGGVWAALASWGVLILAHLCTMCIGFGVQCFFGDAEFSAGQVQGQRKAADAYGGAGQSFIFAPGAALAASVVVTLLLKLSWGELIRLEGMNRATQAGVLVSLGLSVVGLGVGWTYFKRSYFRMLSGFREADFVGFEPPLDYQTSAFDQRRRAEGLLGSKGARLVYRRHHLQYGRRFALTRYLYGALWGGVALALFNFSSVALPPWGVAGAVWLLVAVVLNPWSRLRAQGIGTGETQLFALEVGDERGASELFSLREVMGVMLPPFVLLFVVLRGWRGVGASFGPELLLDGGLIWLGGGAIWAAMVVSGRVFGDQVSAPVSYVVATFVAMVLTGVAVLSAVACAMVSGVMFFVGLVMFRVRV